MARGRNVRPRARRRAEHPAGAAADEAGAAVAAGAAADESDAAGAAGVVGAAAWPHAKANRPVVSNSMLTNRIYCSFHLLEILATGT